MHLLWTTLLVALVAAASGCSLLPGREAAQQPRDGTPPLIVYEATLVRDGPVDLVVADPSGQEQRRMQMPEPPLTHFTVGRRALMRGASDAWYVLDADAGQLRQLDLQGKFAPLLAWNHTSSADGRWLPMADANRASAFAVDLESARTHDLAAAVGNARSIFGTVFSPTSSEVGISTESGAWLVPLGDGAPSARQVGADRAVFVGFSRDGQHVVSLQPGRAGRLLAERRDGTEQRELGAAEGLSGAVMLPDRDLALVRGAQQLFVFALDGSAPRAVPDINRPDTMLVSPDGSSALIGSADDRWYLVEVDKATAREMPQLANLKPLPTVNPSRFRLFAGNASGSMVYRSIDMTNGTVRDVLSVEGQRDPLPAEFSSDGRYALVRSVANRTDQVHLVRADGGEARLVGSEIAADVDDDGRVVISDRTGSLRLQTADAEPRPIGTGYRPFWIGN
jgi:hypothetical protein